MGRSKLSVDNSETKKRGKVLREERGLVEFVGYDGDDASVICCDKDRRW